MANSTGCWLARIVVWCLLLTIVRGMSMAQSGEAHLWRAGIGGGVTSLLPSASFRELSGVPQPLAASAFQGSGSSIRIVPQAFFEYPLFSWGSLGVQAEYLSTPLALQATEQFPVFVDTTVVDVVNTHKIDATLTTIAVEPFFAFPLFSAVSLRVGPRVDVVLSTSFEQSQEITEPKNIDFVGYEGRVVTASGAIPDGASLLFSASIGIAYALPLTNSSTWQLQPSLSYRQGLSNIAVGKEWTMSNLSGGLSLVYAPMPSKRIVVDTVFQRDTTLRLVRGATQERVLLVGSSNSTALESTPDAELTTVVIREQYVRELPRPAALLTTGIDIQFVLDDGRQTDTVSGSMKGIGRTLYVVPSADVAYDAQTGLLHGLFTRNVSTIEQRGLGFHASDMQHHLLAHIQRIAQKNKQTLALAACCDTAVQSAAYEAVGKMRTMCAEVWGVLPTTIPVVVDNRSNAHSDATTAYVSVLPSVTQPLLVRDTLAMLSVQQVVFRPSVVSEAGIREWQLRILRDSMELRHFSGEGTVPPELLWNVQPEEFWGLNQQETIECILVVEDRDGHRDSARGAVVIHSSGGESLVRIQTELLQVVMPEHALTTTLLHSLRETIRGAGCIPVRATLWRSAVSVPEQQILRDIASELAIPQEYIGTRVVQRESANSLMSAYDNLVVITAEPLPHYEGK